MAKYATSENLRRCSKCDIQCTEREMIGKKKGCPNCGKSFLIITIGDLNDDEHVVVLHLDDLNAPPYHVQVIDNDPSPLRNALAAARLNFDQP